MAQEFVEIKTYEYYVFSSQNSENPANTVVLLYGANRNLRGSAWFTKDNSAPLQPATKYPGGIYTLYYSYVDLPVIVDMLRNELPVYLIYEESVDPRRPGIARISTLQEPVGVGVQEPVGEGEQPP